MCAALNAAGAVDLVITTDIWDCFMFGATCTVPDYRLNATKPTESHATTLKLENLRACFNLPVCFISGTAVLGREAGLEYAFCTRAVLVQKG